MAADREDCRFGGRLCLFACRFHLYLDVNLAPDRLSSIFPVKRSTNLKRPALMSQSAAITLEEVGGLMNLTRERVRQLEAEALTELQSIVDFTEEDMTELGARIE